MRPPRTRSRPHQFAVVRIAVLAFVLAGSVLLPSPGTGGGVAGADAGFETTGFFHTQFVNGRWWFVRPDGRSFYSHGVNHVRPDPDRDRLTGRCPYCEAVAERYPSLDDWADTTVDRLESWGFNTIGAWSDLGLLSDKMAYTDIVGIASGNDWFSDEFEARARARAEAVVAPRRDDPNVLGWFLDNELRWGPDFRSPNTMLDDYLALPPGSPGRDVAEQHVGDPSGFLTVLANRYYQVGTEAIRNADPNHLVLGNRLISFLTPEEVVSAAGRWLDVLSVNHYDVPQALIDGLHDVFGPLIAVDSSLTRFHEVSGLPVMVTEYSFRGADTEMPNTWPPIYLTAPDQSGRADMWQHKVEGLYAADWIIGDHWFEWADQPPGGRRGDGEDNNFGLVSNADEPYQTLVSRMTAVHATAPTLDLAPPEADDPTSATDTTATTTGAVDATAAGADARPSTAAPAAPRFTG